MLAKRITSHKLELVQGNSDKSRYEHIEEIIRIINRPSNGELNLINALDLLDAQVDYINSLGGLDFLTNEDG